MGATAHKVAPKKAPTDPYSWIVGLLHGLGAPVTKNNVSNVGTWLANEQTTAANWQQNKGNPLGVQTPTALAAGHSGNVAVGLSETVKNLLGGSYQPIVTALRHNAPAPMFNAAVVASPWNGAGHYGGTKTFTAKGTSQKGNPTGWWGQWVEPIFTSSKMPTGVLGPAGVIVSPFAPTAGQTAKDAGAAAVSTVSAVTSTGSFLGKITNPTNLKNVGIFVAGLGLTVTGLLILFSTTKQAKMVESVATKAAV